MIDTYALDPEVLLSADNPIGITDQFGVGRGRMLAKLPKDWQHKLLYQAKEQMGGTLAYKRLSKALERIRKASISYDHKPFESDTWLEDAERNDWDLRCIVATSNPREHPKVIAHSDMHADTDLWHVMTSNAVPRTAEALSRAVAPLVRTAKQLVLVDPHFDADPDRDKTRFSSVLGKILQDFNLKDRTTLHVRYNDSINYKDDCMKYLPRILPPDMVLSIKRWKERPGGEKLHARYVMSQLGGMAFEVGLDEGYDGQTTDVHLLDDKLYRQRYEQYMGANPAFDLVEEFEVIGVLSA